MSWQNTESQGEYLGTGKPKTKKDSKKLRKEIKVVVEVEIEGSEEHDD